MSLEASSLAAAVPGLVRSDPHGPGMTRVRDEGGFRYLDPTMRKDIHERVKRTAESIAQSAGATADVTLEERVALTFNDAALTDRMLPSLRRTAGEANVLAAAPSLGGEDFSYYQQSIPGLFIWLGIRTLRHGHWVMFLVGIVFPLFWIIGALIPRRA